MITIGDHMLPPLVDLLVAPARYALFDEWSRRRY
jgi:hypothetical protein